MSVDFSGIIDNFLTAELGEDVRGSLVEIARALEAAINSQLNTVTSDLTDTDPNTAAQAAVVGALKNIAPLNYGKLASGSLNEIPSETENCFYLLSSTESYTETPVSGSISGILLQLRYYQGGSKYQYVITYNGLLYGRVFTSANGWGEWSGGTDATLEKHNAAADSYSVGAAIAALRTYAMEALQDLTEETPVNLGKRPSGSLTQNPQETPRNAFYLLSATETYTDAPVGGAFSGILLQLKFRTGGSILQYVITSSGLLFSRVYTETTEGGMIVGHWTDWSGGLDQTLSDEGKAAQASAVGARFSEITASLLEIALYYMKNEGILTSDDFNKVPTQQLHTNGIWLISATRQYANAPVNSAFSGMLIQCIYNEGGSRIQVVITANGLVFCRLYTSTGGWLDWHGGLDTSLAKANVAADAKAVGDQFELVADAISGVNDVFYGGSDHTNKTPWIANHYNAQIESGGTFDIRNMPKDSFIYKPVAVSGNVQIEGLPAGVTDGNVFVARRPLNGSGNVSTFTVLQFKEIESVYSIVRIVIGDYIESATPGVLASIRWTEIPFNHANLHDTPISADDITTDGLWWSETKYPQGGTPYKTITGFPFSYGYLFSAAVGTHVRMQIAIEHRSVEPPMIRFRYLDAATGEDAWTGFESIGKVSVEGSILSKSDAEENDWMLTEFEENDGWYTLTGEWAKNSGGQIITSLKHSQKIPVCPGRNLFGSWFGGKPPQECGGAFFDASGTWIAPIDFPYNGAGGTNVTEQSYPLPDVTPGSRSATNPYYAGGLTYARFWQITVPQNAYYVALNLQNDPNGGNYIFPRSLGTLPIIGATGSGNKIWRRDDPQRAIKNGKRLYVIGPSYASIDRSYRKIYDYDPDDSLPDIDPEELPTGVICGFQEYFAPYYDDVVTLGFNGKGYVEVVPWIKGTGGTHYEDYNTRPLNNADEVLIVSNGNLAETAEQIGNETDVWDDTIPATENTYCAALNAMIDEIERLNNDHPCRIYLSTRFNNWDKNNTTPRPKDGGGYDYTSAQHWAGVNLRNEKTRAIAEMRGLALIDVDKLSAVNYHNYKFLSYDSYRDVYRGYGGHPNNEGNKVQGLILLQGLLNGG